MLPFSPRCATRGAFSCVRGAPLPNAKLARPPFKQWRGLPQKKMQGTLTNSHERLKFSGYPDATRAAL
jgi:hypothetical protein